MKWLAFAIVVAACVLAGAYILVNSGAVREDKQRVCVEYGKQVPGTPIAPQRSCIRWVYK